LTPYFQDGGDEVIRAEKCCYLVSTDAASARRLFSIVRPFLIPSTVIFVSSTKYFQTDFRSKICFSDTELAHETL